MTSSVCITPTKSVPKVIGTSATDIYEAGAREYPVCANVVLCNITGSAVDVGVMLYDVSATTTYYLRSSGESLAANTTEVFDLGGLVLEDGDIVRAIAGTGSAVHAVINFRSQSGTVA